MVRFKNYVKAGSLSEAYELNQKKSSIVGGGMMWLKLQNRVKMTLIDLSGLGLDTIEETDEEFRIGCMCTLRMLETHEGLNTYFQGVFKECTRAIVGVQFRNGATVGGSVFGRFGFSDIMTCLMALDTYVELYQGGVVSLKEFNHMKYDRDILVRIIIKKDGRRAAYAAQRRSGTDFPLIACCVAKKRGHGTYRSEPDPPERKWRKSRRRTARWTAVPWRRVSIWRQYERKRRIPEASDRSLRRAADEAAWRGGVERGDRIYLKWKSDVCGDQGRYIPV